MNDRILTDELYPIHVENGETFMVNQKYDRIDFVPWLGHWMIKVLDDTIGLVTLHVDENTARLVHSYTHLPIVGRDTLLKSEYEGYLTAQTQMIEDWNE